MANRRFVTAKRVVFWGPISILAVLYFFGHELGFFPGGSPQMWTESGPPADITENEDADVDETTIKVMAPESNAQFRSSTDTDVSETPDDTEETASTGPRMLHILIDGRELFVDAGSSAVDEPPDWQPIGLNEVVKRSRDIPPNVAGLRVLISRRGSSRVSAEMDLLEALHQAGITDDEIHIEEKLVP